MIENNGRAFELNSRIEIRLQDQPLKWDTSMRGWSSSEGFRQTIEANSQSYYLYLNALVAELRPQTILELGTCHGGSTLFMLLALQADAHLVSIDQGYHHPDYLLDLRDDARLTLLVGDSCDLALYPSLSLGPIDFLFIDTDHTCAQATKEWELYRPLMSPKGIVAMDDIHMNDMDLFWNALPNEKVDTGNLYHWTGFGIFSV